MPKYEFLTFIEVLVAGTTKDGEWYPVSMKSCLVFFKVAVNRSDDNTGCLIGTTYWDTRMSGRDEVFSCTWLTSRAALERNLGERASPFLRPAQEFCAIRMECAQSEDVIDGAIVEEWPNA